MLDFLPDTMAGGAGSLARGWTIAWEDEDVSGRSLLLSMTDALRKTGASSTIAKPRGGRLAQSSFQPERMSGYCASS
jgi:hypothetical protein